MFLQQQKPRAEVNGISERRRGNICDHMVFAAQRPHPHPKIFPMPPHLSPRLFITGIPTAGKSFLAKKLAEKTGGLHVCLDDIREELAKDDRYKKWTNFYLDRDEKKYLTETPPNELWNNLVRQSEALWPALLAKINEYSNQARPLIFESVNLLPHLAKRDLPFPGIVLLGESYESTLERNIENPRWGNTAELQELEARTFWEVERPHYKDAAAKHGFLAFERTDTALAESLKLLTEKAALSK